MKVWLVAIVILALSELLTLANGLRVLGIFPHPAVSHFNAFRPILKGLADAGHDVTVLSHFPDKRSEGLNYHDIVLDQNEIMTESVPVSEAFFPRTYYNLFMEFYYLAAEGNSDCQNLLKSEKLDQIMNQKYDVFLTEYFETECALGIAYKLKIPVFVGLSSCALMPWHTDRVAIPDTPSYLPSEFVGFSQQMSIFERFQNWLITKSVKLLYRSVELNDNRLLADKFGPGIPDVRDLASQTKLFLVNQHFSYSLPKPLPPNVIEVGGVHISSNKKSLPEDLQNLLDNAKYGVIYVSWGSLIKAHTMPEDKRVAMVNAFRRMNQTILWKYENDTMPETADNLHIRRWMPQLEILCHPNVKVFMSHAGNMGTTEAAHCGKPTIFTPFYGDQYLNAKAAEYRGMGILLQYDEITEKSVYEALQKALMPNIKQNAEVVSKAFVNRLTSPLETAIYWIEYVAGNEGKLLQTPAVRMNFFAYHSLDSILLLATILILIIYITLKIVNLLVNRFKSILRGKPIKPVKTRKLK